MFYNRVINFWNKFPDNVVLATIIPSFKRRLLSFMGNFGSEHFPASQFVFIVVFSFIVFLLHCFYGQL